MQYLRNIPTIRLARWCSSCSLYCLAHSSSSESGLRVTHARVANRRCSIVGWPPMEQSDWSTFALIVLCTVRFMCRFWQVWFLSVSCCVVQVREWKHLHIIFYSPDAKVFTDVQFLIYKLSMIRNGLLNLLQLIFVYSHIINCPNDDLINTIQFKLCSSHMSVWEEMLTVGRNSNQHLWFMITLALFTS